jgi:hypothetical protein
LTQVESQLASVTAKYNRLLSESEESVRKVKAVVERLENDNASLVNQLEEERKYAVIIICTVPQLAALKTSSLE